MPVQTELSTVAVAISAFRSDDAVIALLEQLTAGGQMPGSIIVVDSLGSGRIAEFINARGWPVQYENSDVNLGSAGNLALRLQIAAATDCEWCLTLNHDAHYDPEVASKLVNCALSHNFAGAVYPSLRLVRAGDRIERPRRALSPWAALDPTQTPSGDVPVKWSSSNGALYSLKPVRAGVRLWSELWMGYEDLAIGWELDRAGWTQWLCTTAEIRDDYEYRAIKVAGRTMHFVEKPPWYEFYGVRNLILIAKHSRLSAIGPGRLCLRFLVDLVLILGLRSDKRRRLRLWLKGFRDGLRGRDGKGEVP